MAKRRLISPKKTVRRMTAKAKCASFDIELTAQFAPHGLASDEINDVQRKLKQKITEAISSLPFAHIYPWEVRLR